MFGTSGRFAIAVAWFWVLGLPPSASAQATEPPSADPAVTAASLNPRTARVREPVPLRSGARGAAGSRGETTAGWWLGPVGIAAALAVVGGISLASKRFNLNLNLGIGTARDLAAIGVVGQTRLSPKHAVYLVRVGTRVLIIGAGPGGSPTTLGEVTDPSELARLIPRRAARPATPGGSVPVAGMPRTTGFDQRIGDDE